MNSSKFMMIIYRIGGDKMAENFINTWQNTMTKRIEQLDELIEQERQKMIDESNTKSQKSTRYFEYRNEKRMIQHVEDDIENLQRYDFWKC